MFGIGTILSGLVSLVGIIATWLDKERKESEDKLKKIEEEIREMRKAMMSGRCGERKSGEFYGYRGYGV
jgi:uncharacterized protein YacL (UPF0231 family)